MKRIKMYIDPYEIILKESSIKIGCQKHSPAEWIKFTDEEISDMDTGALEWWHNNSVEIISAYYYAFVEKTLQIALMKHEENSDKYFHFLITKKNENNQYYCNTYLNNNSENNQLSSAIAVDYKEISETNEVATRLAYRNNDDNDSDDDRIAIKKYVDKIKTQIEKIVLKGKFLSVEIEKTENSFTAKIIKNKLKKHKFNLSGYIIDDNINCNSSEIFDLYKEEIYIYIQEHSNHVLAFKEKKEMCISQLEILENLLNFINKTSIKYLPATLHLNDDRNKYLSFDHIISHNHLTFDISMFVKKHQVFYNKLDVFGSQEKFELIKEIINKFKNKYDVYSDDQIFLKKNTSVKNIKEPAKLSKEIYEIQKQITNYVNEYNLRKQLKSRYTYHENL